MANVYQVVSIGHTWLISQFRSQISQIIMWSPEVEGHLVQL